MRPVRRRDVTTLQWRAPATVWTDARVRSSVLACFGHMWELYTMWVMVPLVLAARVQGLALSWAALPCWVRAPSAAPWADGLRSAGQRAWPPCSTTSGLCCCLATPWMLDARASLFFGWLLLWGVTVAGDSPSSPPLTARNAPQRPWAVC